ncbi:MAG: hypothetical protein JW984_16000 [Deltaproteobacteria bacterium]|uniref:DUF523 domain-containing protein n=1 Tax=Candidatus Zymogenus saltonus TaxID=2844893 RepID=A0A9D8KH66_9DELT|nr:hypothetical protein [Candidatus Zymogenus saltonus]
MDFKDNRKRKIVFVSHCILNQNLRFPGIAVQAGACSELVEKLLENDLGIEQIPCLERLGWGGVSRKNYFRYQPLFFDYADTFLSGLIKFFGALWIYKYGLLCKREARRIVKHTKDYIDSDYSVVGIITVNDSPTDGITQTLDLLRSAEKLKTIKHGREILRNPELDKMRESIPLLCEKGTGIFAKRLKRELKKKNIDIKIVGYDPWADQEVESKRVISDLKNGGFEPSKKA